MRCATFFIVWRFTVFQGKRRRIRKDILRHARAVAINTFLPWCACLRRYSGIVKSFTTTVVRKSESSTRYHRWSANSETKFLWSVEKKHGTLRSCWVRRERAFKPQKFARTAISRLWWANEHSYQRKSFQRVFREKSLRTDAHTRGARKIKCCGFWWDRWN